MTTSTFSSSKAQFLKSNGNQYFYVPDNFVFGMAKIQCRERKITFWYSPEAGGEFPIMPGVSIPLPAKMESPQALVDFVERCFEI